MPGLHDKGLCPVWNYENAQGIINGYKNDNAHVAKAKKLAPYISISKNTFAEISKLTRKLRSSS